MQSLLISPPALAYQPPLGATDRILRTPRPGIPATDAWNAPMSLARFQNETITALQAYRSTLPARRNLVDVLGDARADRYRFALEHVTADPNVDGLLVVLTPQAMTEIEATAQAVGEIASQTDKPILACFMGEARVEKGIDILQSLDVPNYPFPERAALAFEAMSEYRQIRSRPEPQYAQFDVDRDATRAVLARVRAEKRFSIGDSEARQILTAYGLHIPQSEIAATRKRRLSWRIVSATRSC
jgi:acetyltransferase